MIRVRDIGLGLDLGCAIGFIGLGLGYDRVNKERLLIGQIVSFFVIIICFLISVTISVGRNFRQKGR